MSHKKTQHLDYLEDAESDYESDTEVNDTGENDEKIVNDIRDAMFEYVKESSMPICEFLSQEAMSAFIEHTLKKCGK